MKQTGVGFCLSCALTHCLSCLICYKERVRGIFFFFLITLVLEGREFALIAMLFLINLALGGFKIRIARKSCIIVTNIISFWRSLKRFTV